jgi:hypothetical protein
MMHALNAKFKAFVRSEETSGGFCVSLALPRTLSLVAKPRNLEHP